MGKEALTLVELQTRDTYDNYAGEWSNKHIGEEFWKPEFDMFSRFLPQGNIFEIGSGGGRDARELVRRGYGYTGTDVSTGFLAVAREVNPGVTFLEQSVYDMDFPEGNFDGFWASAVLLHVPKDRIDTALGRINRVTRHNVVGFISLKEGDCEEVEDDENGGSRLFSYYRDGEFSSVLARNKFNVLHKGKIHLPNKHVTWLTYFVEVHKEYLAR